MFDVKMLPGQEPYTEQELKRLYALVHELADAVTEQEEIDHAGD